MIPLILALVNKWIIVWLFENWFKLGIIGGVCCKAIGGGGLRGAKIGKSYLLIWGILMTICVCHILYWGIYYSYYGILPGRVATCTRTLLLVELNLYGSSVVRTAKLYSPIKGFKGILNPVCFADTYICMDIWIMDGFTWFYNWCYFILILSFILTVIY